MKTGFLSAAILVALTERNGYFFCYLGLKD